MTLRNKLIRLAHANPGPVQDAVLPLLTKQASWDAMPNYDQDFGTFERPAIITFRVQFEEDEFEEDLTKVFLNGNARSTFGKLQSAGINSPYDEDEVTDFIRDANPRKTTKALRDLLKHSLSVSSSGEGVISVRTWSEVYKIWKTVVENTQWGEDTISTSMAYYSAYRWRLWPEGSRGRTWGEASSGHPTEGTIPQWLQVFRPS